ncbi:MAG: hypothetical protein KAT62_10515 [Desulfuromonadales bacterium]|nr:hypothetical protein [Desulfuromonadales bacterium]
MILVTVGTTLTFDDLIMAVDQMVTDGQMDGPVVCQIGNGSYVPQHCEYFRFKPNLDELIQNASVVIGHGGTGTVLGLLAEKKKFIAVANPLGAHDHQAQFLERLSRAVSILWTRDLKELPALIRKAEEYEVRPVTGMRLAEDLRAYLEGAC